MVDVTHRVHALVAPSVWRTEVALAIDCLAAATIERLVLTAIAPRTADPLDFGAVVVVWHAARAIPVLDISIVGVTPDAVEEWWRGESGEKG
jgi:hypothetical protein